MRLRLMRRCGGRRWLRRQLRDSDPPEIRPFLKVIPAELPSFHEAELIAQRKGIVVVDQFQRLTRRKALESRKNERMPLGPGDGSNVDRVSRVHGERSYRRCAGRNFAPGQNGEKKRNLKVRSASLSGDAEQPVELADEDALAAQLDHPGFLPSIEHAADGKQAGAGHFRQFLAR